MDKYLSRRRRGGGDVPCTAVVVSAEAAATEMRYRYESSSDAKEEGCRRMDSRMQTAAAEVAEATVMMRQSGVYAPVVVRHELPVWSA